MVQPETHFLRLFPLQQVVLFPGAELPLVVFEPRYLQLTKECTDADEPFGVLLLKAGREVGDDQVEPFTVGTSARIVEASPMGHGRLSVTAVGADRFRVISFNRDHPYLSAEVEYLTDASDDAVDPTLVDDVKRDAISLVRAMTAARGGFVRNVQLPDEAQALSFQVAQLFQGNAAVQQQLLELDTPGRLEEERTLLQSAMRMVSDRERREGPGSSFSRN